MVKTAAVIRSTGYLHADGVERWTIDARMSEAEGLPFIRGKRVPVTLEIGGETYAAGLRTTNRTPLVYVCADLVDAEGGRARLGEVLARNQFTRNQHVELKFQRERIVVSAIP